MDSSGSPMARGLGGRPGLTPMTPKAHTPGSRRSVDGAVLVGGEDPAETPTVKDTHEVRPRAGCEIVFLWSLLMGIQGPGAPFESCSPIPDGEEQSGGEPAGVGCAHMDDSAPIGDPEEGLAADLLARQAHDRQLAQVPLHRQQLHPTGSPGHWVVCRGALFGRPYRIMASICSTKSSGVLTYLYAAPSN
jgi:hypothetical protein